MTVIKPRVGQIWAFGGRGGRNDKIKCVKRGLAGRWKMVAGKLAPEGKQTAMYVQWESGFATIGVRHLWKNWVCIEKLAQTSPLTPSGDVG